MDNIFRISFILLIWGLSMVPYASVAGEVVVAVAADGETIEASVSSQAARSPYFLLFDAQGDLVETVNNPHQQAAGGAGPLVVDFLAAKGVRTVIAGEFGFKMTGAMQARGMAFQTSTGSAVDAVRHLGQ